MRDQEQICRWRRLAATLVVVTALGGCAAGGEPRGSVAGAAPGTSVAAAAGSSVIATASPDGVQRLDTGAIKACALLTSAQIEAAIGAPVVEAVDYGEVECRWTLEPMAAFPGAVDPWIDVQFWENDLPMRAVESGADGVGAIDGLGDRAFRTDMLRHLWVLHGTDAFVIRSRLRGLTDESDATRDAAEAIELVLARLVLDQL